MSERFEQPKEPFHFNIGPLPVEIEVGHANRAPVPFVRVGDPTKPAEELRVVIDSYLSNDPDMASGQVSFEGTTEDGRKVRGYMRMDGMGEIEFV